MAMGFSDSLGGIKYFAVGLSGSVGGIKKIVVDVAPKNKWLIGLYKKVRR